MIQPEVQRELTQDDVRQWADRPQFIAPKDDSIVTDGLEVTAVYAYPNGEPEKYVVQITRDEVTRFRQLWHYLSLWETTWMGVKIAKYPTDMWIYQQLLVERRFDLIVECGTFCGGSALFFAQMCELLHHGRVITIDIEDPTSGRRPQHSLLEYITASSTDPNTVASITDQARGKKVLVVLDSDHTAFHVFNELNAYAPIADYLIVEDTNIHGHPIRPNCTEGPGEAVAKFLTTEAGQRWEMDRERERLLLTANPGGYLRRKS